MLNRFSHVRHFTTLWTGSSVHGILQERTLEWVATPSSGESSRPRMERASLTSPVLAGRFFTPWEEDVKGSLKGPWVKSLELECHPLGIWKLAEYFFFLFLAGSDFGQCTF